MLRGVSDRGILRIQLGKGVFTSAKDGATFPAEAAGGIAAFLSGNGSLASVHHYSEVTDVEINTRVFMFLQEDARLDFRGISTLAAAKSVRGLGLVRIVFPICPHLSASVFPATGLI